MVLSDAYFRTFFIKGLQYGTAFVIRIDDLEYLVTARHLVDTSTPKFNFKVFAHDAWSEVEAMAVGHGVGEVDISLYECPPSLGSTEFTLVPAEGTFALGQDMFFLGFPYMMWGNLRAFLDGRPCAFVKRGTLSFFDAYGQRTLFIDAINNEGFSGGPLLFYPPDNPGQMFVAGVVSKFKVEHEAVLDEHGEVTAMQVPYNTGFMVAYGMANVVNIIHRARGA